MKIKISTFKSVLHDSNTFTIENKNFIESLENQLNTKFEITSLDDYDCDLKLIFIQTGGSEGLFLENFDKLQAPFYLLTSGGNNSLAASLEIMTYLSLNNLNGEILHGDIDYLTKRIRELFIISHAKAYLKRTSLGLLGKPSDWLIASTPNYEQLHDKLGIRVKHIPLSKLEEKQAVMDVRDLNKYQTTFDKKELDGALRIYKALKEIVAEERIVGLSIRCFDLLTSLHQTGCLALSKLNDEGIIGTCEGDVMAMVSMQIISSLTSQPSFQANPSRIDTKNNDIVFAHCTIPLSMTTSYKFDTHFESGIGVAIKGELKEEKVTIFRLSSDLKTYTLTTGTIVTNLDEKNLCRTQIKVHLDDDVSLFLKRASGNHHIICYGDHKNIISSLMEELI